MKKMNKNIINILIVWLFYKNCIKNVIKKFIMNSGECGL